jgi:ubiquitin thioesterase OTU1
MLTLQFRLSLAGKGPAPTSVRLADGSAVVRRIIPSDNSCLFTAVGYVMEHDRGRAAALRQVIAEAVAADPGGSSGFVGCILIKFYDYQAGVGG